MTTKRTGALTTRPSPAEDLALLRQAAIEAGRIAMQYFHGHEENEVAMKGEKSPVSTADYAVDRYLRETLTGARPDYGWLSEETEESDASVRLAAARTFVVDPIDGTRAFLEGQRTWCVSAAVVEDGAAIAGVLSCPALGEEFEARTGGGAWKNGDRLQVARDGRMPVIAGPKTLLARLEPAFPDGFTGHGHVPSLAYRLAMVADGTLDATIVKPKSHDWDIAAAELILREAGGRLAMLDGGAVTMNLETAEKPAMIAGRPQMLELIFGVVGEDAFG